MNSNPEPVASWMLYLYMCVWIFGVANAFAFKRFFKSHQPEEFKKRFPSFFERSMASDLRQWEYIWKRGYSVIDDPEFVKRCDLHRLLLIISFAGVAAGLVAGFFLFRHHPTPA